MYGRVYDAEIVPYPPRVTLALQTPGKGFHTVLGGIDLEDHRFSPRFAGVVNVWKDV